MSILGDLQKELKNCLGISFEAKPQAGDSVINVGENFKVTFSVTNVSNLPMLGLGQGITFTGARIDVTAPSDYADLVDGSDGELGSLAPGQTRQHVVTLRAKKQFKLGAADRVEPQVARAKVHAAADLTTLVTVVRTKDASADI